MSVVATIWNFVIKVREKFSNWILETGYWNNAGVWDNTATWNSQPTGKTRTLNKFRLTRIGAWVFNIVQYGFKFNIEQEGDFHFVIGPSTGDWILAEGFWNDDGIWIDSAIWKDS